MKNRHLSLTIITLLLLFQANWLYAQKHYLNGYVITNAGDTLHGTIKDRKLSHVPRLYTKIKFKNHKGRKKNFRPSDIAAYKRGEDFFRSVPFGETEKFMSLSRTIHGEKHFLKIILNGHLTLYGHEFIDYEDGPYIDINYYLKRAGETQFIRVPLIGFRKRMKVYFSDSYPIVKKLENKEYRYRTLLDLVMDYNLWYKAGSL